MIFSFDECIKGEEGGWFQLSFYISNHLKTTSQITLDALSLERERIARYALVFVVWGKLEPFFQKSLG